jgi:hypothetical protein
VIDRIIAIVRADFLTRFRRLSTVVIFLLLSAFAYVWVPDPRTGMTLMQIRGSRVLYNSAAIGMGTAMIAAIFVGLAGFYVISNAVKRDVMSRCGHVMASTTMRSSEYIAGKFLGNVIFLTVFMSGFMIASMIMQLVRGEAPLQPVVFATQYAILVPAIIMYVSALAIVFESIPWLAGRFGDVFYFFFWAGSLGVVGASVEQGKGWGRWVDFNGLGFLFDFMKTRFDATQMSIGHTSFDKTKAAIVFPGLYLDAATTLPRIVSTLAPLLLLPIALIFFHRFDPARARAGGGKSQRSWMERFNAIARPLSRPFVAASMRSQVVADAMLTFAAIPLAGVAFIAITIMTLASPHSLPIAFAVMAVFIADVASRDRQSGTTGLLYAAPKVRERFVIWKIASSILVACILLAVPIIRTALAHPSALPALLIGIVFVAAAATSLGIISSNAKTFIVLFLSFWYVVINDKGVTKSLDFAGFFGTPFARVSVMYVAIGLVLTIVAQTVYAIRLRAN